MIDYKQQEYKDIIKVLESHGVNVEDIHLVNGVAYKHIKQAIIDRIEEELTPDKWHPIKARLHKYQPVQGTAKFIDRILRGEV